MLDGNQVSVGRLVVSADPEAMATYVYVREGKQVKTVCYNNGVYVDVDEDNNVLGIEFL